MYPDSKVYTDIAWCMLSDRTRHNYLILNYDKFQIVNNGLIQTLQDLSPDLIVLDEVQLVKQRTEDPSIRRIAVETLVRRVTARNPKLYVLGMSGTPVINNLREAKKTLELVIGKRFLNIQVKATIGNALATHRAMMCHGLRFRAHLTQKLNTLAVTANGTHLLRNILDAGTNVLSIEQVMLPARLEAARPHIRKGTLIYTHYVDGMVEPIQRFVWAMGFTCGVYTGEDKSGLDAFKGQEIDVLIGSAPVAVGLNGLQEVSDRLVILSLPWTHAQYEQLVGRLHRQGSRFEQVDVVIPEVSLEIQGHSWSWDFERMELIKRKRTLAECVTDGVIPDTTQLSHEEMLRRSRMALDRLIEHLIPEIMERTEEPTLASALGIRPTVSTERTTFGHAHTA